MPLVLGLLLWLLCLLVVRHRAVLLYSARQLRRLLLLLLMLLVLLMLLGGAAIVCGRVVRFGQVRVHAVIGRLKTIVTCFVSGIQRRFLDGEVDLGFRPRVIILVDANGFQGE